MDPNVSNSLLRFAGRLCAILLALVSIHHRDLAAQTPGTGSIRGTVINEATRTFVDGATVTLEGTPSRTAVTDSQGAFFIGAVPAGAHRLRVESSGTTPANVDVNNVTDSAKRAYQGNPSNPTSVRYYDWAVNFWVGWSL